MAITAIDNDVIEHYLVFTIISAGRLQALEGTNFHSVLPGLETGFVTVGILGGPLFEATRDLPGTEAGELNNEKRTDKQRQPLR